MAVSDRYHKSGPEYRYQLKVRPERPAFSASVTSSKYEVKAGAELELKVHVARIEGHASPLEVHINGLPEGLTCEPVEAPAKPGEAKLQLKADPGITGLSIPFSIEVAEKTRREKKNQEGCLFAPGQECTRTLPDQRTLRTLAHRQSGGDEKGLRVINTFSKTDQ